MLITCICAKCRIKPIAARTKGLKRRELIRLPFFYLSAGQRQVVDVLAVPDHITILGVDPHIDELTVVA